MRYKVSEIEDQIIATLEADTTNFSSVAVDTYAGQVSPEMFFDPEYMQGFVRLLPFCYVSYQGRVGEKANRDSSGKTYIHTLTFRIFTGAKSLRKTEEAVRSAYDMLAACFDDLHGKVPYMTSQLLPGYTAMSGTAISTSEFNPLSPLYETGGQDEILIVNLPGIVIFQSDYAIRLLA
jgi:phage gp37-like protein